MSRCDAARRQLRPRAPRTMIEVGRRTQTKSTNFVIVAESGVNSTRRRQGPDAIDAVFPSLLDRLVDSIQTWPHVEVYQAVQRSWQA